MGRLIAKILAWLAILLGLALFLVLGLFLRDLQAGCTQLDLPDRFFARDIQNAMLIGNGTAQLQQHGGFAHARLAAQQHNAAQHDAAAQHTVQL